MERRASTSPPVCLLAGVLLLAAGCGEDTSPAGPRDASLLDGGGGGGGGGGEVDSGPACATDLTACDGTCVDTTSDVAHCGECGNACDDGSVCFSGSCSTEGCPAETTDCGGSCVDTDTSSTHCGECGNACGTDRLCEAGTCVCEGDLTACGSECIDTSSDVEHCGECGNACAADERCMGGSCVGCETEATLSGDVQPIFTASCAVMGCHSGARPSAELSLEADASHANLVGVSSSAAGCGSRILVDPGSPETSYLLDKLRGTDLCAGKQMPLREPALPSSDIELIEAWICRGAMND